MRRSELQYELPDDLIAQAPVTPRDASHLLVLHRATGRIEHAVFHEIGRYLRTGDCLVLNDTRVIPARFYCRRATGGVVEALFLREVHSADGPRWRALLQPAGRVKVGQRLAVLERDASVASSAAPGEYELVLIERHERGEWSLRPEPPIAPLDLLRRVGRTPLPPYIRGGVDVPADADRYQTVFAVRPGAVAAPTAGLHFTPELLARLDESGVRRVYVTLHIGAGTFAPIDVEELSQHRMHAEWFEVSAAAIHALRAARAGGGRIVAVGSTSARVLESLGDTAIGLLSASEGARDAARIVNAGSNSGEFRSGWTDIFIYPPYEFRNVDALLTNFHLPRSTLLALVMAFATPERIRAAYAAAIRERYRFYSYGDAMLIL